MFYVVVNRDGGEDAQDESEYKDVVFFESIYSSLSAEGIVVVHVAGEVETGDAPQLPKRMMQANEPDNVNRVNWIQTVSLGGFPEVRYYEENHGGFIDLRSYLVGFKSTETIINWNRNEASVSLEIKKRSSATVDGASPFRYFDGPTMVSYSEFSTVVDASICKHSPDSEECEDFTQQFDRQRYVSPRSPTEAKECPVGDDNGSTANSSILGSELGSEENLDVHRPGVLNYVSDTMQ